MIDPRDILKSFFETGDVPTQAQFGDLIDSYVHKTDDGVTVYGLTPPVPDPDPLNPSLRFGIGTTTPEARLGILADKLNGSMISFHSQPSPAAADWFINLATAANQGFRISQAGAGGDNRLFIQNTSGYIGVGTQSPQQLLHMEGVKSGTYLGIQLRNLAADNNLGWIAGHNDGPLTEPTQNGDLSFLEITTGGTIERLTLSAGGNVGVGTVNPDAVMHAFGNYNNTQSRIALAPKTGILEVGQVEASNILFDGKGMQARSADIPDPAHPEVFIVKYSELNLQPLGGDILFHSKLTAADDEAKKGILTRDGWFGLGLVNPKERMDLNGAIRIGDAVASNPGTIRYSNASGAYDFEGYVNGQWISLTSGGGGGGSDWTPVTGGINYAGGNVGIGVTAPDVKLTVNGGVKIGDTSAGLSGTIRYSNQLTGIYDLEGFVNGQWKSLTSGSAVSQFWQAGPNNIHYTENTVGIGTDTTNALLHVIQRAGPGNPTPNASIIQNDSMGDSSMNISRIGLELKNTSDWHGSNASYDIGLYVSSVRGKPDRPNRSLAALMNGNVVIGDLIPGDLVGENGKNVLSIGKGVFPLSPMQGIQIYCGRGNGADVSDVFSVMSSSGQTVRLYKGLKLDQANRANLPDSYTLAMAIIENMRTRINQLESRLTDLGLLELNP